MKRFSDSRRRWLFTLALLMLLLIGSSSLVSAQGPVPAGHTLGIEVDSQGSWRVVEFLGQPVRFSATEFNVLAKALGWQLALPTQALAPDQVALFAQAGVEQITLALEDSTARVWLNEDPVGQVWINQEAVKQFWGVDLQPVLDLLGQLDGTAFVRFTPSGAQPDLSRQPEVPTTEVQYVNAVHLAATLSLQGQWRSLAGFTPQEIASLGIAPPADLDPVTAGALARFDRIAVNITEHTLMLSGSQAGSELVPLAELTWSRAGRQSLVDLLQAVGGFRLQPGVVEAMESWLTGSDISFVLYVSDQPRDVGETRIELGRPVQVFVSDVGTLQVDGMPLPGLDLTGVQPVMAIAQQAGVKRTQVCWQGDEIRWLVANRPMPPVVLSRGWLPGAIRLAGLRPLPVMDKIEQLLNRSRISVAWGANAEAVRSATVEPCDYQVAAGPAPLFAAQAQATWVRSRDELRIGSLGLPGAASLSLPVSLQLPGASAFVPAVGQVKVAIGPGGIGLNLDGVEAGLAWDSATLANAIEVVSRFGLDLSSVTPIISTARVGFDVEVVEQPAPSPEEVALEKLREAVSAIESTAATSQGRLIATAAEAVSSAQAQAEQLFAELEGAQQQLTDQQQRIEQLSTQLEEQAQAIDQLAQRLGQLQTAQRQVIGRPVYVVQAGDSLRSIWVRFGWGNWKDWLAAVVAENNLTDPDLIRTGQLLVMPQQ